MLNNIRVLDLTMHLSGPYCCWLLGSLGADVIKVERPEGGDPARGVGPFVHGQSTYFASVNRNKRGICLDLKSEDGKKALAELIKTADVLVENFRAGVLTRLGFGEDRLKTLNPNLIHASITGFGQLGEMAKRPVFDIVVQGMSGMMSMTGAADSPTKVGVSIADLTSGIFAALDILAALLEREQSGATRRVDISMLDCQLALLENAASRFLNAGEMPLRVGNRHPKISPFQAYPTKDGMIVVAADGEPNWKRLCAAMGLESIAADPRFAENDSRVKHYDQLEVILFEAFSKRPSAEWLDLLIAADVPCGPINTVAEALAIPQVRDRGMISRIRMLEGVAMDFVASPVGARGTIQERPAPRLGEHNDEVMAELGLARATANGS